MIISDLNLLETVEGADVTGGLVATKLVTLTTVVNQAYNVSGAVVFNKSTNAAINSAVNVTGNASTTVFENSALGANTYTESNVSNTVVQGQGSESAGTLTAGTR